MACYSSGERVEWPGMSRRGASGAHASTGWVGKEGREGSEGMGVNERASKQAKEGSSLRAGIVRNSTEGSEWCATCTLQANHAHCFLPPSMKSLPFYMVSDDVEKVCMGC